MLYHLLVPLSTDYAVFNVFKYITFRTIYSVLTALVISFLMGPWLIRTLSDYQIGQPVRQEGPERHYVKRGTPTMGGVLILFAIIVPTLLWADLANPYVWVLLTTVVGFGAIGFWDDYLKVIKKNPKGLAGRYKFLLQCLVAGIVAVYLYRVAGFDTHLTVPFLKGLHPDLGILFVPFTMLVIVGASNAVNLTDGLDGLAIGPVMIAAATYLLVSYLSGHARFAGYLQIPYIPGSGEMAIVCGAMVGAAMGFLWFNTYPASVFMGDVGSLPLGAALGAIAVASKHELLLVLVGGIFVLETISVILQVGYFKMTRKRIFLMSPIHHHFELKGWQEPKIIVRFWIISIVLALLALSTLKLR
ncbi:MAG: phospho-N-acetylmuramoyl-pentapeptide-transferase [Nitrospirota bacterium]|nr:phospho-N-acetylmuramoyl-pentapeptide-transferase [Nitrospirota bacterium]